MKVDLMNFLNHIGFSPARFARPGAQYERVAFVPKTRPGDPTPWVTFGSTAEEYKKWIPEVCGICCLKMAGDTFGVTKDESLYDLTLRCLHKGGFREQEDDTIEGVFHYPLMSLARKLGLQGSVEKDLDVEKIKEHLANNRMVLLSIDLAKATTTLSGGHIILVHRYLPEEDRFLVNDCAYALGKEGADIPLPPEKLMSMTRGRGMCVWA